ncbi:hypothetical protein BaRGS_00013890 [Batillaria attramentaria]|uniref:Uncharacterized protein n=1 Tax=Batillaria attramentaria TaxID=370345 RepID=A0ABD0L673_9CAEN
MGHCSHYTEGQWCTKTSVIPFPRSAHWWQEVARRRAITARISIGVGLRWARSRSAGSVAERALAFRPRIKGLLIAGRPDYLTPVRAPAAPLAHRPQGLPFHFSSSVSSVDCQNTLQSR